MLRALMPRTRLEWVEKLAGAAMWIAIGASAFVVSSRPDWAWPLSACIMVLAVISAAAGIPRRRAGRTLVLRNRAVQARPRTLAAMSRLMPGAAGRRWLAEAESVLAEVAPTKRRKAVRSYVLSAPRLALIMWTRELRRRP
jgi:hypothetical protein